MICILKDKKKIIVATPNNDWMTSNWSRDIHIIDNIVFNIQKYLDERGVDINNL